MGQQTKLTTGVKISHSKPLLPRSAAKHKTSSDSVLIYVNWLDGA
jgi:hypothetical protein